MAVLDRQHSAPGPEAAQAEPARSLRETAARPTDPERILAMQRTAGNAAVGRLLARQPARPGPADSVIDPFADDDEIEQLFEAERQRRAHEATQLREGILEHLERRDALGFLSALRRLDAAQRFGLERDERFWREVRRHFGGLALWSIQLTVEYGATKPHDVRALSAAIHGGEWRRTRDLLMAYPRLKRVTGVRQALAAKFSGRELDDLQRAVAEPDGARAEAADVGGRRAHYEDGEIETYGGGGAFELVRMSTHVRVIVRIRLRNDDDNERNAISDEAIARWERGISRYWNGKFRFRNAGQSLDVYFIPVFMFDGSDAHHNVRVLEGDDRSAMRKWYEDDSEDTAAHEFGHMIGNPDEYNLPGTMAELPADFTDAERRRSSWEGIFGRAREVDEEGYDVEGLMGSHGSSRAVEVRHAAAILQVFNARLRRGGERPWTVEKRR